MNKIIAFIRPNDNELFTVNQDGTFSNDRMKKGFPNNIHQTWSQENLEAMRFHPVLDAEEILQLHT